MSTSDQVGRSTGRPARRGAGPLGLLLGVHRGGLLEGRRGAAVPTRAATTSRAAARPPGRPGSPRRASTTSPGAARRSRRPGRRRWGAAASPTRSGIVLPREKSRGWSLVIIRWVPHRTTGTSGHPGLAAIRTAPVLNSLSSIAREIVASREDPDRLARPGGSRSRCRSDASPSPRSTSMWCIERISGPVSRWSKSSRLAMNRTLRPDGLAARPP